jgi:hypothetical protein
MLRSSMIGFLPWLEVSMLTPPWRSTKTRFLAVFAIWVLSYEGAVCHFSLARLLDQTQKRLRLSFDIHFHLKPVTVLFAKRMKIIPSATVARFSYIR